MAGLHLAFKCGHLEHVQMRPASEDDLFPICLTVSNVFSKVKKKKSFISSQYFTVNLSEICSRPSNNINQ